MKDSELIRFEEITKRFPGTLALDKVSFSIRKGEIHSIVGANGAGKSTLMNILGGQYRNDGGTITFDGEELEIIDPYHSIQSGISIVYQELKLCDNLTVTENIFLGNEQRDRIGRIKWKDMAEIAKEKLDSLKAEVSPWTKLSDLTVGKKQLVEIAKALTHQSKVIILDEPTSALSMKDAGHLFENIFNLKEQGVTVIFISHRMEEIFKISDRITVLRDGRYLGTFEKEKVGPSEVVDLIAGKSLAEELSRHAETCNFDEKVMEVRNLGRGRLFRNVDLDLYRGETLGIYGLQGAGRTELLETLFGIERADEGEVKLFGETVSARSPKSMISRGVAMVPEDRRGWGIFPNLDVKDNVASAVPEGTAVAGFLVKSRIAEITREYVDKIGIKLARITQKIVNLSGGNQQKTIIAKWLTKEPRILLLDEVTRGIDVGAKAEIFKLLRNLKNEGISIVLVSSEIEEILAECDRTLIMWNGRIVGDVSCSDMDRQKLLSLAMGVGDKVG